MSTDETARYNAVERQVQQAYGLEHLSVDQTERHLERLKTARLNATSSFAGLTIQRRELGAIAAILVLVLAGILAGQALTDSDGNGSREDERGVAPAVPTSTATPEPTPQAAGYASGVCVASEFSDHGPPDASQAAFTDAWFGEGDLWAGLGPENEGIWSATDLRVLWWRAAPAELAIAGERLDDESPPLEAEVFAGYEGLSHQTTTLSFPQPGCWEVSARAGDQELSFVVDVLPREEGPRYQAVQEQIAEIESERERLMPYPVPESCVFAEDWSEPDFRIMGTLGEPRFAYWQDDVNVSVGTTHGVLFSGENDVAILAHESLVADGAFDAGLNISGYSDEESLVELVVDVRRTYTPDMVHRDAVGAAWWTTIEFPSPGCWSLFVSTSRSGEVIEQDTVLQVYVYPEDEAGSP